MFPFSSHWERAGEKITNATGLPTAMRKKPGGDGEGAVLPRFICGDDVSANWGRTTFLPKSVPLSGSSGRLRIKRRTRAVGCHRRRKESLGGMGFLGVGRQNTGTPTRGLFRNICVRVSAVRVGNCIGIRRFAGSAGTRGEVGAIRLLDGPNW